MARGEGIKHITNLFDKYRERFVAPKGSVIDAFAEVVRDLYALDIKKDGVLYTPATKTLMLRLPGPVKTEILLRKEEVLAHLRGRMGEKSAPQEII